MKIIFICLVTLNFVLSAAAAAKEVEIPGYVVKAIANPSRSKAERDYDRERLPAQTIAFSGAAPGMVVAELLPFYGYFSRLLSDVVGPNGKIYGIENFNWSNTAFDKKLTRQRRNIILKRSRWGEFDLPEKVDLFWITQNYHDLHVPEYGHVDMAAFNRRVWDALKPGGIYMVVDQAGNPGMTDQQISDLHRIGKEEVIAEVTAAGFVLIDESNALYHARDDHTKSVFNPLVRGQTDQFMLKFQKPAN
ncbi:MAG: class I SAM-dependent methyltransferase, partial [Acidobacteriaceae bacterium]|nr:class I SAM-dependent methyltransferase [Acidobacteriaceae bacterium]